MLLKFSAQVDRWSAFYTTYGAGITSSPNEKGWVNLACPLPTHPGKDRQKHGAINVFDGRYKCFNAECQENYKAACDHKADCISPRDFLVLTQGMDEYLAQSMVEEYRQAGLEEEFSHDDTGNSKKFCAPIEDLSVYMEDAQKRLKKNLPIVYEYCTARKLTFDTLVKAGVGYVPEGRLEDGTYQEECLVFPYYLNGQVVAVRGRTYDGRKGGIKNSYYTLFNLDAVEHDSRICILVEGESDTLYTQQLLRQAGLTNIPVFGTPGVQFQREWKRHLSHYTRIITIPQADEAAKKLVRGLTASFPDKLEVVQLPWKPRQFGKDIVDFAWANPGSEDLLISLLGINDGDIEEKPRILKANHFKVEAEKSIPWVIPNFLERGTKTLIVGEPKTYKTWIALQLGRSVTEAVPFMGMDLWRPEKRGTVLLVEEEGSLNRMSRRIQLLYQDVGVSENFNMIHRTGVRLDDPESLMLLKQDILVVRPDLLILDPYANLHLQDENTVQGTMVVMSALNQLLRAYPEMALVVIHHTPKGGKGARGSGAFFGSVDLQVLVQRVENVNNTIKLSVVGRDLLEDSDGKLEFEFLPHLGVHKPKEAFVITDQAKEKLTLVKFTADSVLDYLAHVRVQKTLDEIREALNLSQYSARASLKPLVDSGRVVQAGGGRRDGPIKYQIAEEANKDANNESSKD